MQQLKLWLWFQTALDGAFGLAFFAAPSILYITGLLPPGPNLLPRILAVVALILALTLGLAAKRPAESSALLLVANGARLATATALFLSATLDPTAHPLLRLAFSGDLAFVVLTVLLQVRAGIPLLPGDA